MVRTLGAVVYVAMLLPAGELQFPYRDLDGSLRWVQQQHDDSDGGALRTVALDFNEATLGNYPGALFNPSTPARELERVIARYTEKLVLDPRDDDAYFRRGVASLYAGSPSNAMEDIGKASDLDPTYPYYALWLDLIDRRSNLPSRLSQAVAQIDMNKWPAPVIRLFLGQLAPKKVLAAAADPDPGIQRGQVCEANFYIGQFLLQRKAPREAARRFELAALDCPPDFVEAPAAKAELAVLGAAND